MLPTHLRKNGPPPMEHAALIYTMVIMSAADSDMTDKELFTIGDIIQTIPAFEDFDPWQRL